MFVSLIEDDPAGMAKVCKETNWMITKKMDTHPEGVYKRLNLVYNYDDFTTTDNLNVQVYLEALDEDDPLLHLDDDAIMPTRLSMMMRGMGLALNYPIRTAERWYPMAKRALA